MFITQISDGAQLFDRSLFSGGGSNVAESAWPGTAVIEGHKGYLDGYVIIDFEEDDAVYHTYTGSKETVTIPEDGDYELTAVGGRGGSCSVMTLPNGGRLSRRGGYGAEARGTFRFSKGDKLHMVVGGMGGDCNVISENPLALPLDTTGAGGAGGTFIEWEEGTSNKQELLLVGGGGGGAGNNHDGGDGEKGKDGGFDWGGKNGQGGRLCQEGDDCKSRFFLNGGAGGGGYDGDGASRCGDANSCNFGPVDENARECNDNGDNVLAEGGKSFQNGSDGGQQVVDVYGASDGCIYQNFNGGFGGFGGGGEGGILRLDRLNLEVENGGGGGGGGYSGGGAGQFQGDSGGG